MENDDELAMEGDGPGWPPLASDGDEIPDRRTWVNERSLTGVWRDTLTLSAGAALASTSQDLGSVWPGRPWDFRPSDPISDVEQAIMAKVHLGIRTLPLLATADLIVIDPRLAKEVPEWETPEEAGDFTTVLGIPEGPTYFDFENEKGTPHSWLEEGFPGPLDLRGALCWRHDGIISVVPYGSIDGQHPWGGTDYQAWARWAFVDPVEQGWPRPGPGDFLVNARGDVVSWVAVDGSICSMQGQIAYALASRALRVISCLAASNADLHAPVVTRPIARRAARDGEEIGRVPRRTAAPRDAAVVAEDLSPYVDPCPVPNAHARVGRAHTRWHEALDAYDDPASFVTALNGALAELRGVTFALEAEMSASDEDKAWYKREVEERLGDDPVMDWLKKARNKVVHARDLSTASTARARLVGPGIAGKAVEMDMEPTKTSADIARTLVLPPLEARVREEGTLVVERRWTVEGLPGDELLEVLAHGHAKLAALVADAHAYLGGGIATCELTGDDRCLQSDPRTHPGGHYGCMTVGRERRTSRRNLASGAPVAVFATTHALEPLTPELAERYGVAGDTAATEPASLPEAARHFHQQARKILQVDGHHNMMAWLFRGRDLLLPLEMFPEDQRAKFLFNEHLAHEVDRLGADALILTAETWLAAMVDEGPDADRRAGERGDRSEGLVTYLARRDGQVSVWLSLVTRDGDGTPVPGPTSETECRADGAPALAAVFDVWDSWPPDAAATGR